MPGLRAARPAAAHILALLAVLPACMAAPAPAPSAASSKDGGTIVFGEPVEPRELNCIRAGDVPAIRICRLVADTLLDYDRNLNVVPRLAESYEASADGKVLTFHLRKGIAWHDGRPFTAKDVLYTVEQIRAPGGRVAGNRAALFQPLESIEAPDEFTVVSRFREPYALAYQAWAKAFIMPSHLRFAPGEASPTDRAPVGTGPFRFVRWDPQQQIVLEANRDYFAERPHLDRLINRYVPDLHTLALALKVGEVDIASMPPAEAPRDDASLAYRILRYPTLSLDLILWNVRSPRGLFTDARVRRAMSLALDRDGYIREITQGNDLPAVSSFHPVSWAHDPDLKPLPYDPNAAAGLLASAGWRDRDGDGVLDTASGRASFTLLFRAGNPEHERLASLFQSAVKRLGVDVSLQGLEWPVLLEKARGHAFDAVIYRWGLDADPDPYDFFHSSQYPTGQNYGGYSNPEVDRLAEQGRRTLDIKARAALYRRLERILQDEQPHTFISHPSATVGLTRRLRDVEVAPTGLWAWYPSFLRWWVAADAPPQPP